MGRIFPAHTAKVIRRGIFIKKERTKLIIAIILLVVFMVMVLQNINNFTGMFNITFPTMEAAINSNWENWFYDRIKIRMVDEPIYIVGCIKNDTTNIETLYHTEKGWQRITGQGIPISDGLGLIPQQRYYTNLKKIKGLTILQVTSRMNAIVDVRDTLDSEFVTYKSYLNSNWLLVLEEVPEGYQLIIDDKRIDIPATK